MNFIIFGGSGFIGTHLIKLLKDEVIKPADKIFVFDIVMPGEEGVVPGVVEKIDGVIYERLDVRKPIKVKSKAFKATKNDIIFNLAAVHRTPGHQDFEYFETNIEGAENVTAWAEAQGISKILFTSSIAPYGAAEEEKSETTLPTPNTPYGISKLVAEKIHQTWAAADKKRCLTIVRPGIVYGKGEHGNMTRLYSGIKKGYFFYAGRRDTIKACIYVKELVRFMNEFGDEVEFVQLQLNYMDWTFQDGARKVDYLNKQGVPIWVMEPLRGGTLVELTDGQVANLKALRPDETPVAWAFRYLQGLDGVGVILSGMSSLEQMKQNIEIFETSAPLNDEEMHALYHVADEIIAGIGVPCTACRYCTDHCPQQLDIPGLLALYNENLSKDEANRFIAPMAVSKMPDDKKPNACIGCGSCVAVCPQLIDIPDALAKFSEMLGLK